MAALAAFAFLALAAFAAALEQEPSVSPWRWWAGQALFEMLIVLLPLWQMVTFLPYAFWAEEFCA